MNWEKECVSDFYPVISLCFVLNLVKMYSFSLISSPTITA